jgi:NitT/TauT family transport system substrate-binding protein
MRVRRQLLKSAGGWALMGALGPLARAQVPRRQTVRVVVQHRDQLKQLPLFLAHHLGFFEADGLEVVLLPLPAHIPPQEALTALQAEVFAGGFDRTLWRQASGHAERAFVALAQAPQVALGVAPGVVSAHTQPEELAGARIGVTGLGDLSHRVAQLVLLRAGVPPSEVQFVAIPSQSEALAAFRQGALEALSYTDPVITQLERQGGIRVVSDTRSLRASQQVFGGPVVCACLSADEGFLQRRPEVAQGLVNGVVRALKWLHTATPVDLVNRLPPGAWWTDRSLFLLALNRSRDTLSADGWIPEQGPANVVRALQRLGADPALERVNPAATYTNALVSRAKQQFRA